VTELVLNRTRRNVLAAVSHGRVTLNDAGHPFLRIRNGYSHRCDKDINLFLAAGWIVLGDDQATYQLTDAGQAVMDGGR
jgi:hypothetical protein